MSLPLDVLDESLQDFPRSPLGQRLSEPPTPEEVLADHMHAHAHARLLLDEDEDDSETASVGGFSPPAWRNLGNGDRSRGFWKSPHRVTQSPHHRSIRCPSLDFHDSDESSDDDESLGSENELVLEQAIRTRLPQGSLSPYSSSDSSSSPSPGPNATSPESVSSPRAASSPDGIATSGAVVASDAVVISDAVLSSDGPGSPGSVAGPNGTVSPGASPNGAAKLGGSPNGAASPDRIASPDDIGEDGKLQCRRVSAKSPSPVEAAVACSNRTPRPENFIRLALRAEVQQTTQPIDTAIMFLQKHYRSLTSTWLTLITTLVVAVLSISTAKMLMKPAAPRPVGDLVKVAGLARSFEPLIYFSEPAAVHVRELQSTSIAIWDLGESVRISGMADAEPIVESLDAISEAMKKLVMDLTRFHTHVDGDIDGILNVMDWAKMHLNRLNTRPAPSAMGHAYDNLHNILTDAHVLEDVSGKPTRLGRLTTAVLGMSNPQREQRMIQKLFDAFIGTIEEAITEELEYSVGLFALFDDIDDHFLRLARHVAHESSTQDEFHAELLSSLWARMLGPRAAELRKFERNRALLHDVRARTVRNKGALVGHHGKLLTLKASLESLRGRLASHLVRGINSSAFHLEDQIRGIAGVRDYLADIRRTQKARVFEAIYSHDRSSKYHQIDDRRRPVLPAIDAVPGAS